MNNPVRSNYEFDVQKSISLQLNLANESSLPLFAPESGVCEKCNENIYEQVSQPKSLFWDKITESIETGIPTVQAGKLLVINCPHCHYDFAPNTFEI